MDQLRWNNNSINVLINITQTPDRCVPSTVLMQSRLGFPNDLIAYDVNLGCSAYPYGIHLMKSLMAGLPIGSRGILAMGDVSSKTCDPHDKATAALFSDVGTATAFEKTTASSVSYFNFIVMVVKLTP